jgi:phenylalanyl-tRNA synthetase alpha chain
MAENTHENTLAALGVTQPEQVAPLFMRLLGQATADLQAANSVETFEKFRVHWLGRKSGVVTLATDNWLKRASPELKRAVGQELNKFKAQLESQMEARRAAIESGAEEAVSPKDRVDLSLPGVVRPTGSRHLIRQVFQEIEDIFVSIGFSVVEGP